MKYINNNLSNIIIFMFSSCSLHELFSFLHKIKWKEEKMEELEKNYDVNNCTDTNKDDCLCRVINCLKQCGPTGPMDLLDQAVY